VNDAGMKQQRSVLRNEAECKDKNLVKGRAGKVFLSCFTIEVIMQTAKDWCAANPS
jgi:hypothetical protein